MNPKCQKFFGATRGELRRSHSSSDPRFGRVVVQRRRCAARGSGRADLMKMIVVELKRELEARAEPKTGSKAWLRRRLHAAIVREHLDAYGL